MPGTKAGAAKAQATMIKKFGSKEAYIAYCRERGSAGGKAPHTFRTFERDPELARRAGSLGGKAPRKK